jgi:hypothetical protein
MSVSISSGSTIRAGFLNTDAMLFGADGKRMR